MSFGAGKTGFSREAARTILSRKFGKDATRNMRRLLQKNNRGSITADDRLVLERYIRVGRFLDLMRPCPFPDDTRYVSGQTTGANTAERLHI